MEIINLSPEKYKNYYEKSILKTESQNFSWTTVNNKVLTGFTYVRYQPDTKCNFLICKKDEQLIGVIKYGIIKQYNEYKQMFCFIDVHESFRNSGIAKQMIIELNNYLDPTMPLFLTSLSDQGELCKLDKFAKENILATKVFAYLEQ